MGYNGINRVCRRGRADDNLVIGVYARRGNGKRKPRVNRTEHNFGKYVFKSLHTRIITAPKKNCNLTIAFGAFL